jgi:hypothetical protein
LHLLGPNVAVLHGVAVVLQQQADGKKESADFHFIGRWSFNGLWKLRASAVPFSRFWFLRVMAKIGAGLQ